MPTQIDVYNEMYDRTFRRFRVPVPQLMLMRYAILRAKPGAPSSWTAAELAEATEIEAAFNWTKAMWDRYNQLKVLNPIPESIYDNASWPAAPATGTYWG